MSTGTETGDRKGTKEAKTTLQVPAIENGTVIDHIPPRATMDVVRFLSDIEDLVTIGINFQSTKIGSKGVVKIGNRKLSPQEVAKIALIAPQATLNIIEGYRVVEKYQVAPPPVVEGIVRCGNPNCITNHEPIRTRFSVAQQPDGRQRLTCFHCERAYDQDEIEIV